MTIGKLPLPGLASLLLASIVALLAFAMLATPRPATAQEDDDDPCLAACWTAAQDCYDECGGSEDEAACEEACDAEVDRCESACG